MPPARLIASATLATPSAFRSSAATRAPCAPKRRAIARPIPLAAPVTITTRPSTLRLLTGSAIRGTLPSLPAHVLVPGDVEPQRQLFALVGSETDPARQPRRRGRGD